MSSLILPTQHQLHDLFDYDEATGVFMWRKAIGRKIRAGDVAGSNHNGYIRIRIEGKGYKAHRLAWMYVHGTEPGDCIDHINGVTDDNRMSNLRAISRAQNNQNRVHAAPKSSGIRGVNFDPDGRKWRACIYVNRKPINLGRFENKEDAAAAYAEAKKKFHPFQRQLPQ